MEIDPSQSEKDAWKLKSESLSSLSNGSISSCVSKLSGSSRALPSEKDFHFYYNFDEFKAPIDEIGAKSQSMLQQINSAKQFWGGKEMEFPQDVDDEGYDWLVNVNDEVIEKFDVTLDEFTKARKLEAEKAKGKAIVDEHGFQLVCGKKKKGAGMAAMKEKEESVASPGVRVVERDRKTEGPKQKVPFHISSIRRPQEEYNILVNNSNQPFQHVWLERSEDNLRFIHPLEKLSVHDFVDSNLESLEPMKPRPLESTPFKLVEEVKDLKELAAKLRSVNEFSVDLEHNQYRSFQGLTCLMQISTRTEDFVVDTLKLRIHIGPYLREVFKDPTKKKVMHGADRDIAWLQRDFGIYVCNLFDTGQASRVLNMERFSLEHLLQHFCGVTANKQYQNADWRLRPLPREMMRYAREDTHYLLYIYDLMRIRLLSESTDPENSKVLLEEVYKRSYDLCMQLYEKELLTETSYLYIYGVQAANLNAQQLSIVAALCEWRDAIARAEDESTGYILPNKILLEIAKQMPLTTNKLRHLVKSKHPYVERNLGDVVTIIRHSVQNASCFEAVAQQLKEAKIQMASELNNAGTDIPEVQATTDYNGEESDCSLPQHAPDSLRVEEKSLKPTGHDPNPREDKCEDLAKNMSQNGSMTTETKGSVLPESQKGQLVSSSPNNTNASTDMPSGKAAEATVQLLKKPGRAFGALLGSSASKKKIDLKKDEDKLEQIKSSVNLPFYSFKEHEPKQPIKQTPDGTNRTSNVLLSEDCPRESDLRSKSEDVIMLESDRRVIQAPEESNETFEDPPSETQPVVSASDTKLDDIICLDSDSNDEEPADNLVLDQKNVDANDHQAGSGPELVVLDEDDDEEQISLSDLSSSFQKCLQSTNPNEESRENDSEESGNLKFKPFDYEAARDGVKFGEGSGRERKTGVSDHKNLGKKKGAVTDRSEKDEGLLPQGKRRQAFPASGNRSATFRAP